MLYRLMEVHPKITKINSACHPFILFFFFLMLECDVVYNLVASELIFYSRTPSSNVVSSVQAGGSLQSVFAVFT